MTDKEEFLKIFTGNITRDGADKLLDFLENKSDFFTAPASTRYHNAFEGGLLRHSLNVYHCLCAYLERERVKQEYHLAASPETVAIVALLHDVCKADIYKRSVKKRKNKLGQWEDCEGYKVSYKDFPMGHGEKSLVVILLSGLELYDDEMLAIRWHMGAWGLNQNSFEDVRNYDTAQKEYPLVAIIHAADVMAANVMERTGEEMDEL